MIKDEFYVLYNGVKIPKIGFGTWQNTDKEECIKTVVFALQNGYRHIDTAQAYGNEEYIQEAIKRSGIARKDIFITSKLPAELKGYDVCKKEFEGTLKRLGTDYLDLYLIHAPNPWSMDQNSMDNMELNIETWKMMEELYNEGKIRAIGVSNFNVEQIELLRKHTKITPMVNQVYCHIGEPRLDLLDYLKENNILLEAYSPLKLGKLINHPELIEISNKYDVSVAQLCIRWCLMLNTLPLPKSVHEEYILSNLNVDFDITIEDFEYLKNLK